MATNKLEQQPDKSSGPEIAPLTMPEQNVETPEKDKKIVEDFNVETRGVELQQKEVEDRIKQREEAKKTNLKMVHMVPASFNEKIDRDIEELKSQGVKLSDDLKRRDLSDLDQGIREDVIEIEGKIQKIKNLEKQDLPGMVPFSIKEGREKDMKDLEAEKDAKIREAEAEKVERIRNYYKGTETKEKGKAEGATEGLEFREPPKKKIKLIEREGDRATEVLSDPEVMRRKPEEVEAAFKEATGEDLIEKRDEMVAENLKARRLVIVRGKEAIEKARQRSIEIEQGRILQEEHVRALETLWKRNPSIREGEKGRYLLQIKKKMGLEGPDGDLVLDRLINDEYVVEKTERGWFTERVKIPKSGKGVTVYENQGDLIEQIAKEARSRALGQAEIRADDKIIQGRKLLTSERLACTKKIIDQAVEGRGSKKQQGQEVGPILDSEKRLAKEWLGERENGEPKEIEGSESFKDLYKALKQRVEIVSGTDKYTSGYIIGIIDQLRALNKEIGKKGLKSDMLRNNMDYVTRAEGLRRKVWELLSLEGHTKNKRKKETKKRKGK